MVSAEGSYKEQRAMDPHPLKVAREQRGWSQAKVAKMLGVSTRTVSRWERYESVPYPFYREQLCTLFDKSPSELGLLESDQSDQTPPITIPLPPLSPTEDSDRPIDPAPETGENRPHYGFFTTTQGLASSHFRQMSLKNPLLWISILALAVIVFSLSFLLFRLKTNMSSAQTHPNLYATATSGTPTYSSPMSAPDNGNWEIASAAGLSCGYAQGGYRVIDSKASTYLPCYAGTLSGSNFTFQVDVTLTPASNDGAGVIFRHTTASEYRFRMGSDGSYDLATPAHQLLSGSSSAIHKGADQSNLITIVTHNSNITIYVNKHTVASINDSSSSNGSFGLFAVDFTHPTTAQFSNVELW
jgi:transcriptional regulator with XRE-family HTH domain